MLLKIRNHKPEYDFKYRIRNQNINNIIPQHIYKAKFENRLNGYALHFENPYGFRKINLLSNDMHLRNFAPQEFEKSWIV